MYVWKSAPNLVMNFVCYMFLHYDIFPMLLGLFSGVFVLCLTRHPVQKGSFQMLYCMCYKILIFSRLWLCCERFVNIFIAK